MDVKYERWFLLITFPIAAALFGGGFYGIYANLGLNALYDAMFGFGLLGLCLDVIVGFLLCLHHCDACLA